MQNNINLSTLVSKDHINIKAEILKSDLQNLQNKMINKIKAKKHEEVEKLEIEIDKLHRKLMNLGN